MRRRPGRPRPQAARRAGPAGELGAGADLADVALGEELRGRQGDGRGGEVGVAGAGPDDAKATLAVDDLRCEYLVNPLGIDARAPRLSWTLKAARPGARELALRYLSSSTHSVAAVAQMTGYASPSSFTRWFAAEFGTAPAAWRAEERAERDPSQAELFVHRRSLG